MTNLVTNGSPVFTLACYTSLGRHGQLPFAQVSHFCRNLCQDEAGLDHVNARVKVLVRGPLFIGHNFRVHVQAGRYQEPFFGRLVSVFVAYNAETIAVFEPTLISPNTKSRD